MGFKDYYDKAKSIQALSNKSAAEIGDEVESAGYHTQDIIREERFIPRVDFKFPKNFARYGSAQEYYEQSLRKIYEEYPYDGSLKERLEWENSCTYLDLHVFDKQYPRTNGYINLSAGEWGTQSSISEGYGLPADVEYIYLKGGPNVNPDGMIPYKTQFTGANYYEPDRNRENNLQFDLLNKGVSVEFWLKKEAFDLTKTEKEVIFDLWNGNQVGSSNYGRFRLELTGASGADCFRATVLSGGHGFEMQSVAASTVTSEAVADGTWHHYALTMMSASNGVLTNFYLDGNLNKSQILGSSMDLNEITGALRANIGALITTPASSSAVQYAGKLSASLDEFRYWKTERSGKEIGRHWFTQVGGGTNTDPTPFKDTREKVNTNLGVYYKFNEGITGVAATDSVVLDYSGRITNGSWTGYTSASRATGSAIVLSTAATKEYKDPIIYAFHPEVSALAYRLQLTGSEYDVNNNASMYNSIPSWITEEDEEGQRQLKYLVQIMSSYFDTLHLQIESLSGLGDINYASGSHKPLPFADRLLRSSGLMTPDLFVDADVLEKLADRSEDRLYEKSLADVKNTIYQNIYNNLVYIYKTKGTEKAFRNLIRCFGIDDDLIKLNMYGNGIEFEIRDNRRTVSVVDKFIDFNTEDNRVGTVFQFQDPTDTTNTTGYIPANTRLTGGFAQTLEADVIFPLKPNEEASYYYNTNVISASLFGVHTAHDSEDFTTWATSPADATNFQVYAVRDEVNSDNVRFVLTGTAGGRVPVLVSDLYEDVYDNTYWNLAVRIKPEGYPQAGQVLGAPAEGVINNYVIELHGAQLDAGVVRNEFTLSGEVNGAPIGFVTGSKRAFIGAHRTNFTGSLLATSDVKVNACRYWMDYVDDAALVGHAFDTQNYGSLQPHRYAFPFLPSGSVGEILQADTLMLNWEFSQNTGSNASGEFTVVDQSSGSAVTADSRFDWLGDFLGMQFPGKGQNFKASSIKVVDKDHVISSKLQLPQNLQSSDMVTVLGAQEQQVFTRDSRPINYFFAFEKSMAQALSAEMINYFATIKDVNNLIGEPVNRYRPEYKGLKLLRQRFFERVGNTEIDFEKFYEFYKWFDSSLTVMLQQLVPASADFAENVRTIIESHMLERSKYQSKFQNVKQQLGDPEGVLQPGTVAAQQGLSPDSDPTGTGFYSANAHGRRQIGTSQPINFKNWRFVHAPPPELGESFAPLDKKAIWWKSKAARNTLALVESTPNIGPGALKNKQVLLKAAEATNARAQLAPYKFGAEGNSILGGVGFGPNKKLDFVFVATSPFGGIRGTAAKNVMVGFRHEVEELMNTKDVYWPAYKQRLGFQMNPDINRAQTNLHKGDGNMLAPFSVYSSSVTTGQNLQVIENYAPEIEITNLHHDIVQGSDTPLQGPFPEKFVGGRQYRHTPLNQWTGTTNELADNSLYRAEGWKLKFTHVASQDGGNFITPMLGIVPPNYDDAAGSGGFNKDIPTAHRLRNVGTKRPVNIQNVLMTTASEGLNLSGVLAHGPIGNYTKNYEVVQSSGREKNDPFFNDQSFSFALNPETLATRGRFPLQLPGTHTSASTYTMERTLHMMNANGGSGSSAGVYTISAPATTDVPTTGLIDSHDCTISLWVSCSANAIQQADPVWGASGQKRPLFTWGGYGGSTPESHRWIAMYSGSSGYPKLGIHLLTTAGTDFEWRSDESFFTTEGWHHILVGMQGIHDFPLPQDNVDVYIDGAKVEAANVSSYTSGSGGAKSGSNLQQPGSVFTLHDGSNWAYTETFHSASIADVAFWGGSGSNHASTASWATGLYPTHTTPNPLSYVDVLAPSTQQLNCGKTPLIALENARGAVDLLNPTAYDYNYATNLIAWWPVSATPAGQVVAPGEPSAVYDKVGQHTMSYGGSVVVDKIFEDQSLTQPSLNTYGGAFIHHTWSAYYENCNGGLEYELPDRTGANSNQSIIVNRFSAGGAGYEVRSRGYMDPAHEELSVYNATTYRNRRVLNFGNTGSAGSVLGADLSGTIHVLDQISRPRGLRQVSQLHCGPFGSDAVYGDVVPETYVTVPSFHKTNRNSKKVLKEIAGHSAYFGGSLSAGTKVTGTLFWVYDHEVSTDPSRLMYNYPADPWSMSIWVRPDTLSPFWGEQSYSTIWSTADNALSIDSNSMLLRMQVSSTLGAGYHGEIFGGPITANAWNHVTVTKKQGKNTDRADAEYFKIYVDGIENWYGTQPESPDGASSGVYIAVGGLLEAPAEPYVGSLSEMMWWWGRTLTDTEVASVYNGGVVADIYDPSLRRVITTSEARQGINDLDLPSGAVLQNRFGVDDFDISPDPDLFSGLKGHWRFHQFSGSQVGGTESSHGYGDSPLPYQDDDTANTQGVINTCAPMFSGSYPVHLLDVKTIKNLAFAPIIMPGNYPVEFRSEGPTTVEWGIQNDNLFVQHQIPRSMQQYSWVTASLRQFGGNHSPIHGTHPMRSLQTPSCFIRPLDYSTSGSNNILMDPGSTLDALAVDGPVLKGNPSGHYQTYRDLYQKYQTRPAVAITGSQDNLLFKTRKADFIGLNSMILDPVSSGDHILGNIASEQRPLSTDLVPAAYEAAPLTALRSGIHFNWGPAGAGSSPAITAGSTHAWDTLIGTGSANANKMSWAWWMRKDGDAFSGYASYVTASVGRIVQFGPVNTGAHSHGSRQFFNFFIGMDQGRPDTLSYAVDPSSAPLAVADTSYLCLHANTWTTTSGSWIVTDESGGPTIENHKWYHVVMTYDASDAENDPVFYINGLKYTTTSLASHGGVACYTRPTGSYLGMVGHNPPACQIGGGTHRGQTYVNTSTQQSIWNGMLGDFAAWNKILTETEAVSVYNGGADVNIKEELPDDLVGWWRFSEGAGDFPSNAGDYGEVFNRALPTGYSASMSTMFSSPAGGPLAFGIRANRGLRFPVSASVFPARTVAPDLKTWKFDYATSFSTLNLGRNGPYGYPTWKQIRTGEHKVARQLRKENKIGVLLPPPTIKTKNGIMQGLKSNDFVDYVEPAVVYDTGQPIEIILEDNTGDPTSKQNNMRMKVSYQNNLDYFTNEGLNNRLGLGERISPDDGNPFNAVADYIFDSSLSAVVRYGQKIYPRATNTTKKMIRTREAYDISTIWNEARKLRSKQLPLLNSQGFRDPGASIWPLDAPLNLTHSPTSLGDRVKFPAGGTPGTMFQGGGIYPGGLAGDGNKSTGYLGLGAGELQNTYARFGQFTTAGTAGVTASLAYTMPVRAGMLATGAVSPAQGKGCLLGAVSWTAHESASMPYRPYEEYARTLQILGKNMSIVPEFRISDHLEEYINTKDENFLSSLNKMFSLTGAAVADSDNAEFFKVYSTTDFLKYFKAVDGQLADKPTAGGPTMRRHVIELSCDALLQFLPYKGFYPAERTVELGRILSQSLGDMQQFPISDTYSEAAHLTSAKRILLEPLMAPGILFNSIKSGIACSSLVVLGERDQWLKATVDGNRVNSSLSASDTLWGNIQESNLDGTGYFYSGRDNAGDWGGVDNRPFATLRLVSSASKDTYNCTVYGQPIPFEAIRDPDAHLSAKSLMSRQQFAGDSSAVYLYDTGLNSASLGDLGPSSNITAHLLYEGNAKNPLYRLGIDNFLCETVNFFQQPLKSFVSKPEEEFLSVEKDVYYGLNVNLHRSPKAPYRRYTSAQAYSVFYTREFGMYSRMSAFGPAVQLRGLTSSANPADSTVAGGMVNQTSFEPWLPPHYYGFAEANIIFKAPYSGKVDLDTILGNSAVEYRKMSADSAQAGGRSSYLLEGYELGYDVVRPQITSSVDILEKLLVVPPDTNEQQARWLIQPKFETPVLNFYDVPCSASHLPGAATTNQDVPWQHAGTAGSETPPKIRGMWHQYGKTLSGSEGIHLSINPMPTKFSSSNYGFIDTQPLNKIVGMPTSTKRIGNFADTKKVEEAIVCIPFLTVRGDRKFFDVEQSSQEYVTQLALLNKYIFPPTLDFLLHRSVKPVAFYALEFSLDLTQKDLMDMWQNCAPTIASQFKKGKAVIQIEDLVDTMLEKEQDLQWMVFKVKRRAEKDYSVFTRKGLVEGLPIVQPSIDQAYSYNWPYDFFSFVELIKINETVVYATDDVIPEDDEGKPVVPDLREFIPAPKKIPKPARPPVEVVEAAEEGEPTPSPKRQKRRRRRNRMRATTATAATTRTIDASPRKPSRRIRRKTTSRSVPRLGKGIKVTRSKPKRGKKRAAKESRLSIKQRLWKRFRRHRADRKKVAKELVASKLRAQQKRLRRSSKPPRRRRSRRTSRRR